MRLLTFILSHSIFVAFCAVALTYQTQLLLHLSVDIFLYGFIFFATLSSYNFYWLLSKYSFRRDFSLRAFIKNEIGEIILLACASVALLFCFFQLHLQGYIVVTSILLTALYALPLLPFKLLQFTRKAGVLKTTLLAFTWTYVTAFIPMQKTLHLLTHPDLFILTRRFLFMLMLCIIFDNRDIAVDKIRGLRTLATDLPPRTMKYLIYGIFAVLFASNFFFRYYGISLKQSIALQVSTLTLLATYYYSQKKQGYFFYYFLVDGLMLFSSLSTYIASI